MLILGHRGAKGYVPENTVLGVREGLRRGADGVEVDVRFIDGELVLFHDDMLERTTSGKGRVSEVKFSALRSLDAGQGERVPLAEEILREVGVTHLLNLEMKGRGCAAPLAELLIRLNRSGVRSFENLLVSAFDHRELRAFAGLCPSVARAPLLYGMPLSLAQCGTELGATHVVADFRFVDEEFMADTRSRGLSVFVYTVNDPGDVARLDSLGVAGIISDFPDRVRQ